MKNKLPLHVAIPAAIIGYSIAIIPLALIILACNTEGVNQGIAISGVILIFILKVTHFKKVKWRDIEIVR